MTGDRSALKVAELVSLAGLAAAGAGGAVRRWQGNAGLQWGDADIAEVARHLNDTIYHFPQTADRVSIIFRLATP